MDYLIFDTDGDLVDLLNFQSEEEFNKYKLLNPSYSFEELVIDSDDFSFDDDDEGFPEDLDIGDEW